MRDDMIMITALSEVNVEEEIDRLQKDISVRSIADLLWGGTRGPGLVYTVTELTKTATSLSQTVSKVSQDMYGEDGIRSAVRSLRKDVDDMRKIFGRAIIVLVLIGLGTLLVDGRVVYTILPELAK